VILKHGCHVIKYSIVVESFIAHHVFQANIGAKKRGLKKTLPSLLQFLVVD
jgi:hypothetical protein